MKSLIQATQLQKSLGRKLVPHGKPQTTSRSKKVKTHSAEETAVTEGQTYITKGGTTIRVPPDVKLHQVSSISASSMKQPCQKGVA
jgi:hypothetical protein